MKIKEYDLPEIVQEIVSEVFPDCKVIPKVQVTHDPSCVAKCVWLENLKNSEISVNDFLLTDLTVLIQALTHELIHHSLYCKGIKDHHGKEFQEEAERINMELGQGYVGTYGEDTLWKSGE